MENKRVILLCNNSRLFEKTIVNRLNQHLNFTEGQAGARPQKSPLNNLLTIKSITQHRKHEGKKTYVPSIDIEKAYDRVWSNAIFYLLWDRGIKGKLWRIIYKLNQNLKSIIPTKFGQTDAINIGDSIRQSKPLSGLEFTLLIDQLNVDIRAEGYGIIYSHLIIVSLLFMDDITLIAESERQHQEILNQANLFFNKWHLKFNAAKSAVEIFHSKQKNKTQNLFKIGSDIIQTESQYKFSAEDLRSQMSLIHHITEKSNIVEGLMRNCIFASTTSILSKIKMQTLLNFYKSCIIPALVYGCETWIPTIKNKSKLTQIQLSVIRRTLKIPTSTPLVSIYIETGESPIILECEKLQITYLWVLLNSENQIKDMVDIQLKEYKSNAGSLAKV